MKAKVYSQSEGRLVHKATLCEEGITVDEATEQRPLKPGWLEPEAQGWKWPDGIGLVSMARTSANRRDGRWRTARAPYCLLQEPFWNPTDARYDV